MIAAIQNGFKMSEPVCLAFKQTNKMIRALSSLFYGEIHSNMCSQLLGERKKNSWMDSNKIVFYY